MRQEMQISLYKDELFHRNEREWNNCVGHKFVIAIIVFLGWCLEVVIHARFLNPCYDFKCLQSRLGTELKIIHLEILTINLHKAWFDSPAILSFIDLLKDQSDI